MEKNKEKEACYQRTRSIKKRLKYVPRHDNIHRYPVLKYFAETAKKRTYLSSFRTAEVVPALYVGWILALRPVMSVQNAIACVLSFYFGRISWF
jgi:hypothetical protein